MLTVAAPAPSASMKGPLMLAPPSYVVSANRLTNPITRTKANADPEMAVARFITHVDA